MTEDTELERIKLRKLMKMLGGGKRVKAVEDVIEVKSYSEFKELLAKTASEGKTLVVDFWAPWCPPCLMMAPVFKEVAKELGGKAVFAKVNVDQVKEPALDYGVTAIPTLIIFRKGKPVSAKIGFAPKPVLKAWVERFIK